MGWQVSIKKDKKNVTKYRIWTTSSDGWITEWLTKEEMVKFFFWNDFQNFIEKFLENAITFPNKYFDKKTGGRIYNKEVANDFNKFMSDSFDSKNKSQTEIVYEKFAEVINACGIDVKIKDIDGYNFDSKEKEEKKEIHG